MSALTDVSVSYDRPAAPRAVGGSGGPVLVDGTQAATVGYAQCGRRDRRSTC